jgi:Secretion system C-terminal sorting domain
MKYLLLILCATSFLQAQQLTEVLLNPPTATDFPNEYIELKFPANTTITKYAVLAIEGDSATQKGFLDNKYDLNGIVVGTSGYVLLASTGHLYTIPSGTTVAELITSTNLENSNNILLVSYTDPLPNLATDLDSNDDGILELPAGMTYVDGVSLKGAAADVAYTPNVIDGAALGYTPDVLLRAPNQWQGADVLGTAPNLTIDGTKSTRADLGGSSLTPGAANPISTAINAEQPEAIAVTIFPNPFQQQLQIVSTEAVLKVTVYTLLGQQLLETNATQLDTELWAKGLYVLHISTAKAHKIQTVIKD